MTLVLEDTSNCPIAEKCYRCEEYGQGLAVYPIRTAMGTLCLTLCELCHMRLLGARPELPLDELDVSAAVAAHCQHLGITLDAMSAALASQE